MLKRGLIDGMSNLAINDYQPVWLCNPDANKKCDKTNCQKECFHTLDISYAFKGVQPIYPFAEQANQKLRAEQMGAIASAINRAKEPMTFNLIPKKQPTKLLRLSAQITLILLSTLGWTCLVWAIMWVTRGIINLF